MDYNTFWVGSTAFSHIPISNVGSEPQLMSLTHPEVQQLVIEIVRPILEDPKYQDQLRALGFSEAKIQKTLPTISQLGITIIHNGKLINLELDQSLINKIRNVFNQGPFAPQEKQAPQQNPITAPERVLAPQRSLGSASSFVPPVLSTISPRRGSSSADLTRNPRGIYLGRDEHGRLLDEVEDSATSSGDEADMEAESTPRRRESRRRPRARRRRARLSDSLTPPSMGRRPPIVPLTSARGRSPSPVRLTPPVERREHVDHVAVPVPSRQEAHPVPPPSMGRRSRIGVSPRPPSPLSDSSDSGSDVFHSCEELSDVESPRVLTRAE